MTDASAPSVRAGVVGITDVGKVREHNEDNFLVMNRADGRRGASGERLDVVLDGALLLVVCDGMGGAAAGEVASKMAADRMAEDLGAANFAESTPDQTAALMDRSVQRANVEIHECAKANPSQKGMGTTMTAAVVTPGRLFVSQVGDSRAYILRKGLLNQITKDQSLIGQLIEEGTLTEEEAEKLGGRNIVLQAVGVEENLRVDTKYWPVLRGDVLLVCSDGLSGMVKDARMREILLECGEDLGAAAKKLIEEANANGGRDNVTVILARFDGEGLRAPMEAAGEGEMEKAGVAFKAPPPPDVPNPMKRMGFVGLAILAVIAALFVFLRKTTADVRVATSPPGVLVRVTLKAPDGTVVEKESGGGLVVFEGVRPAEGSFVLTASAAGADASRYESDEKSVEIREPVQVELSAWPVPKPGTVTLTSKTAHVKVRVEAPGEHQKIRPYQETIDLPAADQPRKLTNIPAGDVTVTASRPGFRPWSVVAKLPPAGSHDFAVPELEQVKAPLTVNCSERVATLEVFDEYGDALHKEDLRDGTAIVKVRVGKQSVRVTKRGFKDFEGYAEVVEGAGAKLDVKLAVNRAALTLLGPPNAEYTIYRARNGAPAEKVDSGSFTDAGQSRPWLLEPGEYEVRWRVGNEVQDPVAVSVRVAEKLEPVTLTPKKPR